MAELPDNKKKINRKSLTIILLALLILCGIIAFFAYKKHLARVRQAEIDAKKERLEYYKEAFGEIMVENVPKESKTFPYYQDAVITANATWKPTINGWIDINEKIVVIIVADDEFEKLPDREIYNWLKWVAREYGKRITNVYTGELQEYVELCKSLQQDWSHPDYENAVYRIINESFAIKTSGNIYEYTGSVQDYYSVNGKDHFLKDKKSKWYHPTPTPRPTKKPSGSGKSSGSSSGKSSGSSSGKGFDYYDTDQYDDPEDFWYDYEDEFEDYEDAEDYWEEYHG